jgi:hypothetical protein
MRNLLLSACLAASVCSGQLITSPVLNTGVTPALPATRYDVVLKYHATGSATTTTGTISAGTNTLVVASTATFTSLPQGVFVAGAVATSTANPNGNLVTSVTGISGLTLTLAANATVSVTGAAVKHSDCAAANSAIADAFNSGVGGVVWFRSTGVDHRYAMNCVADPATGGILTIPQNLNAALPPVSIELLGEDPSVTLDFSDAPNVTGNSAFSAAPYAVTNFRQLRGSVRASGLGR